MASKLRVHEVELYPATTSKLRVVDLQLTPQVPPAHLRVMEIQVTTVQVPVKLRVQEIELLPRVAVVNQSVESQAIVTVDAAATQTSGPAVTLSAPSAGVRTFTAPATVDGATITFNVSGTEVTISVKAHQWWVKRAAGWRPFQVNVMP